MYRVPAGVLILLLSMSIGCRRPAPPPPSSFPASADQSVQEELFGQPVIAPETVTRMRPEQVAAVAAARRQTNPPPIRQATLHTGIPETKQQAESLMEQVDRDIIAQDLEPDAARHLRASFRGRLISAGMPKETIEAWLEAKFIP